MPFAPDALFLLRAIIPIAVKRETPENDRDMIAADFVIDFEMNEFMNALLQSLHGRGIRYRFWTRLCRRPWGFSVQLARAKENQLPWPTRRATSRRSARRSPACAVRFAPPDAQSDPARGGRPFRG